MPGLSAMTADRVRKMTTFPNKRDLAVVGAKGPDVARAVELVAAAIRNETDALGLSRKEWNAVAQAVEGGRFDLSRYNSLRQNVAEAVGGTLAGRVEEMTPLGVVALVLAVEFYARHADRIDSAKDSWWQPDFRERMLFGDGGAKKQKGK